MKTMLNTNVAQSVLVGMNKLGLLLLLLLTATHCTAEDTAADLVADAVDTVAESIPIAAEATLTTAEMICVVGAGGTDEYTATFAQWMEQWQQAAAASNIRFHGVGTSDDKQDRDQLKQLIEEHKAEADTPLWIVLIGHGTADRKTAKFNLRGRDVSADDLKQWLSDCQRPLIAINCSSSSGPFLNELQGPDRVVITATSSAVEYNYARFGGYLAASLQDLEADLDHDDQVSLLEAYLLASAKVVRFYESESRLATEHALLEDNHDGKGTPADFFVGIRAGKSKTGEAPDGRMAHRYILVPSQNAPNLNQAQLQLRDELESKIDAVRDKKGTLATDAYYKQLESLLLELARLYAAAE